MSPCSRAASHAHEVVEHSSTSSRWRRVSVRDARDRPAVPDEQVEHWASPFRCGSKGIWTLCVGGVRRSPRRPCRCAGSSYVPHTDTCARLSCACCCHAQRSGRGLAGGWPGVGVEFLRIFGSLRATLAGGAVQPAKHRFATSAWSVREEITLSPAFCRADLTATAKNRPASGDLCNIANQRA